MVFFAILSAFFPSLDSPKILQRFKAAKPGRRLMAGTLGLLLMLGTSVPVHAQMAVADPTAWVQRATQYISQNYNSLYVNSTEATHFLQQAAMTYQDYKQARALYQRITSGNIVLSLVDSLPLIDADDGSGTKTIIRPVFRQQDRLNAPQVRVSMETPNWSAMLKNLDFDVSTVRTATPDAKKSPQQIKADAVGDGWLSWQLAQQDASIDKAFWNIADPNPPADPYAPLRAEIRQHFQTMGQTLSATAEATRTLYGEGSAPYNEALRALADFQQALGAGQADQTGEKLQAALESIDAQADLVIGKYASARNELGMTVKRESAKDQNVQAAYGDYAQTPDKWKPYSLFDFIDGKTPDPPKGQDQGNAIQQNIQQEAIATTTDQHFKYALTNDLREAQGQLQTFAAQKAADINTVRQQLTAQQAKAQAAALVAQMDQLQKVGDAVRLAAAMPEGTRLVLPPAIAPNVPGSVAAGGGAADQALQENLKAISSNNLTLAQKILSGQVHDSAKGMAWDLVKPVLQSFDQAGNRLFGHSFNLSQWASEG